MEIKHLDNGHKGAFYVDEEGKLLAEMTYSFATDKIIIDHTQVSDQLRGQVVGNMLVDAAVAYARDHKLMILPLCPFARSVFDRTPAYKDVFFK